MKLIKDKEFFKVTKEERKKQKSLAGCKGVLKIAKFDKGLLTCWALLFVATVCLSLIEANFTKEILNVFSNYDFPSLYKYALIFLAIEFVYYIVEYFQGMVMNKFSNKLTLDLKVAVYNHISTLKASCFANNQTSTFSQRLNDASVVPDFFSVIFKTIQNITVCLAYTVVLFISAPILSLIASFFYIIKAILYKYLIPHHTILRRRNRKDRDKAHNVAIETIRGANDIKSLNFSDNIRADYEKNQDKVHSQAYSLGMWWRNRIMPTNFFSFIINNVVLLLLIAYFASNNTALAGSFLFFWMYKNNINGFFSNVFDIVEHFSNVEVSASRIMELYDENNYPVEKFGNVDIENFNGKIEFKNVTFSYNKKEKILNKVSFKIEPNNITAIVGKTGCGKSTTLSLIARFYDCDTGKITVDGKNIKDLTKNSLRNNIAYVQQTPYIFNRTFKENLLMIKPNASDEEIIDACKKSEIHDFISTTEKGYDTMLGENGINLSGGQRQRLAIARALLADAKIIMFDESTSALDNENQSKIQNVIENLSKEKTIIVVAHRLSTIINADKIIFIEDNKVLAEGSHKELFKTCDEYKKLYKIENQ